MSVEERSFPGNHEPVWDFSGLHGFQFLGARDAPAGESAANEEQRRMALTLELDARAARFHQAVDSSIVLASDGAIRWLGDPVAKLASGDDLLTPRAVPLVDEAMSAEAQQIVLARLDLWLTATIQRLLGPLFALRGMQEGSTQLQELAAKIANALGVLERESVRSVVRGLDQNARALLRKHGVRFGSYYLYVPTTLRPASRAMAVQLWCLQKGGEDFSAAAQGLIPMASSGRTSAPPDLRVAPDTYRIGGFRLCGDRVVRVDIVERLADMIRAASTLRVVSGPDSGPAAFQVTSQMTSLTGCSGEGFASILRALGFESLTVPRGQIIWPAAVAPVAPPEAGVAAAPELEGAEAASDEDAPAEALAQEPEASSTIDLPETDVVAAAEPEGDEAGNDEDAAAEVPAQEPEPEDSSTVDARETDVVADPQPEDDEAGGEEDAAAEVLAQEPEDSSTVDLPSDEAPPPLEGSISLPVEHSTAVASAPLELRTESLEPQAENHSDAEAAGDGPPEASPAPADQETVTIWRFARAPGRGHQRPSRPPRRRNAPRAEPHAQSQGGADIPETGGTALERRADRPSTKERPAFEKPAHGDKPKTWDIKKAWDAKKAQQRAPEDKRQGSGAPGPRANAERKPVIDPMSPFAKLMELRAILESESKKRN